MKKYLDALKTALSETKRFSETEINDILADHEEMIGEALRSGLSEADIETKFGSPRKVAADLVESCGAKRDRDEPKDASGAVFAAVPPEKKIDIAIRLASDDIDLVAESRADIAVFVDGRISMDRYEIGFSGHEFYVRMKKGEKGGWFDRGARRFDIRIPSDLEVGDIVIQQASGDYKVAGIKAATFKINIASGDGTIADGAFERVDIASVNGDIRIAHLIVGTLFVTQVSGDLDVEHLVCEGDMTFASTSGDIAIVDSTCRHAVFHTVSGDLEGTEFYPESIELHSVSGDVEINNADRSRPIAVKSTKSLSGTIRIREK
ncbi:MAG: DUF4097 family beta strand repeat-containing protein [Candidatus Izemoplasmatales bacterium]